MGQTQPVPPAKAVPQAALDHLQRNKQTLQLAEADIADLTLSSETRTAHNGLRHVYVQQRYRGIPIHGAVTTVNMLGDERVLSVGNRFHKDLSRNVKAASSVMPAENAVAAAARHLGLSPRESLAARSRSTEPERATQFGTAGISLEPITAKLVYQPMPDGSLKLAWEVFIYELDALNAWNIRLDASTGQVLEKDNLVTHCEFDNQGAGGTFIDGKRQLMTPLVAPAVALVPYANPTENAYNVFTLPSESPSHGPRAFAATSTIDPVASPYGWHDTNGAAGAEFTIARGNNVHAYEDPSNNNSGANYSPDAGAALLFDYPIDFTQQPVAYRNAAITNLFYLNNIMHDVWYKYGFDEASGNFQVNNYGRGPVVAPLGANDDVRAEAQDSRNIAATRNNANFFTPIDGQRPRMQMYLWTGIPGPETFSITAPSSLAGFYISRLASFAAPLPATPITGKLVLASTATGVGQEGCSALNNAAAMSGNIALVYRGSCDFYVKAYYAQQAGATAVVMINNLPGEPSSMGGSSPVPITIPMLMISQEIGTSIRTAMNAGQEVQVSLKNDGIGPELDGDFDNGIIAHEYGHGISTRLTGGRLNSNCLNNAEQGGEGWSDWFGLMLTMKPGDTGAKKRGIGTYALGYPTTGRGIRPAPYSTDFAVNDYTYDDTNNPAVAEPHGIGFVWATMLWDLNWAFIGRYGFNQDLYNGTGGNNMAMQLVIDGLKMQPCSPGFVNARDAILLADEANYGGQNQKLIWQVFARRGLGYSATQGSSNNRFDQHEAYDLPPKYACVPPTIAVVPASNVYTGAGPGTIFLGYGAQSVTLQASGVNITTYSWSPAAGLSNPNIANPVFTPTAAGTYTFTVTATDVNSCVETAQVTINVLDVRCGNGNRKVLVCHKGNDLCVDATGAASHLAHGDRLGSCNATPSVRAVSEMVLTAAPNPTADRTTLSFELPRDGHFRLEIVDMRGQVASMLAEGEGRTGQVYQYELRKGLLRNGLYIARLVTDKEYKFTRLELRD
ncbi:metalloprotease [Hymenobacter busanensis]|uniref:Metalloprotease n=2 Tax=Hymenobacter busanensis TaxID=2607656 RepID=A0A7L5A333_9BACT|nr:metalloprotease [Hymenobacter busanensis]QHJ09757.1 metalloprotease [Hymenobacter busanensis]